ncbi:MAG: hypothetical protein HC896_14705 [Bacteroidales bacterium]|nr:hypothetical protein [Bacteroidales bacterium]
MTSVGQSLCPETKDTMEIILGSPVSVEAGNNQMVCANNATIVLNGIVSGGTNTGIWTSSVAGTFGRAETTLRLSTHLILP